MNDVLVGEWHFIMRRKKKILCQCGPLPGHKAAHNMLDIYNGSLHAQHNSNFMLFFTKYISFVTPVIILHLNIFILQFQYNHDWVVVLRLATCDPQSPDINVETLNL